jgi:hypothetical protein
MSNRDCQDDQHANKESRSGNEDISRHFPLTLPTILRISDATKIPSQPQTVWLALGDIRITGVIERAKLPVQPGHFLFSHR